MIGGLIAFLFLGTIAAVAALANRGAPIEHTDDAKSDFVAVPIAEVTSDINRPTEIELAMIEPGTKVIVFVRRPGHPALAANLAVSSSSEGVMQVHADYLDPYQRSKNWTKDEIEPRIGDSFTFPASYIFYVYEKGAATKTAAPFTEKAPSKTIMAASDLTTSMPSSSGPGILFSPAALDAFGALPEDIRSAVKAAYEAHDPQALDDVASDVLVPYPVAWKKVKDDAIAMRNRLVTHLVEMPIGKDTVLGTLGAETGADWLSMPFYLWGQKTPWIPTGKDMADGLWARDFHTAANELGQKFAVAPGSGIGTESINTAYPLPV